MGIKLEDVDRLIREHREKRKITHAGNANLIVSRDLDLLRLKMYGTIGIMSPIDFLHTLEGFKKAA
jgi:predicted nucleic acid-binding protein